MLISHKRIKNNSSPRTHRGWRWNLPSPLQRYSWCTYVAQYCHHQKTERLQAQLDTYTHLLRWNIGKEKSWKKIEEVRTCIQFPSGCYNSIHMQTRHDVCLQRHLNTQQVLKNTWSQTSPFMMCSWCGMGSHIWWRSNLTRCGGMTWLANSRIVSGGADIIDHCWRMTGVWGIGYVDKINKTP